VAGFGVVDLPGVVPAECLPQRGWSQQTADMIGKAPRGERIQTCWRDLQWKTYMRRARMDFI
jgi:hypothetical protein